jgi:asparagine synthase (glutamine-hydrolysing)
MSRLVAPSIPDALGAVRSALQASLRCVQTDPRSPIVLFSGGLDSSLLAWMMRDRPGLRLVTVGRAGSPDLEWAPRAARLLALEWTGVELSDASLVASWRKWASEIASEPEPRRSVLTSLALAFERLPDQRLVIGQGADELFGGYAHFEGLGPVKARLRAGADLRRLADEDWPRTVELAQKWGVSLVAPYLDPKFVQSVDGLPSKVRFPPDERKGALRTIARAEGLPEPLAGRPKKAMQYGTGIARFVRDLAPKAAAGGPRSSAPG